MTATEDEWDWRFTAPAESEYETLQPHEQERIVSKPDEIVNDQWRDPGEDPRGGMTLTVWGRPPKRVCAPDAYVS